MYSLLAVLLINFIFQDLLCPQYQKPTPIPFAGNNWYNPYANNINTGWQKAIFHAHCKAWGGLTNGAGTALNVHKKYEQLGFGVHSVSNYFSIDTTWQHNPKYVTAYEHGTGIRRTHQLVLGSKQVKWIDYLLPQSFSNKQHILNQLASDTNNVVIINHPSLDNAYNSIDMAHLQNYNCIEVLNTQAQSFRLYDAALSSGHAVFMIGNDDNHDIRYTYNLGNFYTCIPGVANSQKDILASLKKGNCYVIESNHKDTSFPKLESAQIINNQYIIQSDLAADSILFIGQNGVTQHVVHNSNKASYDLKPEDTYVRVKMKFKNEQMLYANPIFRYGDTFVFNRKPGTLAHYPYLPNLAKLLGLSIVIFLLYLLNKRKKQK